MDLQGLDDSLNENSMKKANSGKGKGVMGQLMTDKLEGISSKSQEALASYAKHVTDSKEKKDNVNLSEGDNEEKVDFGESEDDLLSS